MRYYLDIFIQRLGGSITVDLHDQQGPAFRIKQPAMYQNDNGQNDSVLTLCERHIKRIRAWFMHHHRR
jgi:hypothetical protein